MENRLCFVQFLHPGGEAQAPPSGKVPWNVGDHMRKFLRARGDYLEALDGEPARNVELGLWGEWEAQTTASPVARRVAGGPSWIHDPYYDPTIQGWRQNTDPFVFGEPFQYTGCRQHIKPKGATWKVPTQLARLLPGSVIVFGSCLEKSRFVVDTVFVVGDLSIDHGSGDYGRVLDGQISRTYREVTIDSWYSGHVPASQRHRLYFGATHDRPEGGIFSFFPCARLDDQPAGFARPRIEIDQRVTQNKVMGFKRTFLASTRDAAELWRQVVDQVLAAGLLLGVRADLPPRRDAAAVAIATARTSC